MQHFRFASDYPGYVFVRNTSDDKEQKIKLLKDLSWRPCKFTLPEQLVPPGTSLERQWYLHHKILEYCCDADKDLVCPQPAMPLV